MRWILFILFCLLGAPAHAVSIPGVTTTTTTDSTTEPAPEPDIEQKKAAYGALADVLDNDTSRKELIDQLRTVAATPPAEPVPKIVPPTLVEEQTVLQKVTEVSRHYGEALSARFGQLYRNITGSPHKPFNPQTFSNALTHFSMLAVLVFGFYWLIRLCALPLYRKMGQWARQKNRERSNWLQLPAMIIGAFVSGMFSRWLAKTITLSPHTQRNYPELQKRLNGWLSAALKTARILTVCVAVMLLLSAWGLFDFWNWLQNGAGQKTVDILIRIALILFFSAVGWTVLASLIENRLASDIHGRPLPSARTRTLLTLFRNALAVIISTITIMIVLSEIGVNIAPLLAGAGALGLAISFGSQTLVKDIITGVFIQFENGMNTGDLVTIGPLTGTVERMSIRSVGVRQDTGAYHIIPWSSITTFANFVRGIGSVVANYDVDRHEDADKANQALKDAVAELMENEEIRGLVIGEPNFAGIVGLSNTAFTLRVSFTTLPLKQWTVRFALDSQVKKHFDLAGVRAPVQTYQVLPAPGAAPAEPLPPGEPTL
ncbi:mechanosensitive channel protein [Escherichia coli]|nr:mechanosensitive channel protein [Escherichia coli]